ncbi:MAG: radical SAM family heme chaperone HemW [Negativicutes bacterium]
MRYGVYLHIPFCRQKCGYCDFPSQAGQEAQMEAYTTALCREMTERAPSIAARGRMATAYVGGGTPTALPVSLLSRVIQTMKDVLPMVPGAELTVEVNPGTVDLEYFTALYTLGVTRLSIGAQSFEDPLLARLGRIHTAQNIRDSVRWARAAGFTNVSLDLMYGLPGQTMEDVRRSVEAAIDVAATHISAYGLTIEEGTPFAAQWDAGTLSLPSEDETEVMYEYLTQILPKYGFKRYEIANFARPGYESRHNLSYWTDVPYAGFGAAAHSYWDGRRMVNEPDIAAYVAAIQSGRFPAQEEEPPTRKNQMEEFCFLALRTVRGLSRAKFAAKFGCSLDSVYHATLQDLQAEGLLEEAADSVRLTERGMKFGNVAFRAFLLDGEK